MAAPNLLVAGHIRPYPGESVSGDAWLRLDTDSYVRLVVIDGAGHGPLANHAANVAIESLRGSATLSHELALKGCHSDLHGTRGAVISLIDVTADSLTYTGVGNADGRLVSPEGIKRLSPDRGLLGASLPRLHSWTLPLESQQWRLVMFSDGIMQRMTLRWELFEAWGTLDEAASALVAEWGRQTDDATMLIAAPHDYILV